MPRLPRNDSEEPADENTTTPGDEPIVETHPAAEDVQAAEPKTVADLEAEVAASEEKPKRAGRPAKPVAEEPEEAAAETGADAPADAEPAQADAEAEPVAAGST